MNFNIRGKELAETFRRQSARKNIGSSIWTYHTSQLPLKGFL